MMTKIVFTLEMDEKAVAEWLAEYPHLSGDDPGPTNVMNDYAFELGCEISDWDHVEKVSWRFQ